MLTYSPDAHPMAAGEACAEKGDVVDRVLQGELVGGLSERREMTHTSCEGNRWLQRSLAGTPLHHALSRYLAELEAPLGTRFDRYV